jgi:SAM-dependent methyltransferase
VFTDEARWIRGAIERRAPTTGTTVLDIGSSTAIFRQQIQPHIDAEIFAPLRAKGAVVTHLDAKEDEGVDLVCDITDPGQDALAAIGRTFGMVLCCNLLEHVVDREATARQTARLVGSGGSLIVTVPGRYPEHHDPIDTLYRPTPSQLAELFAAADPDLEVVERATVRIDDPKHYPGAGRKGRRARATALVQHLVPPLRWRQTCLVLRRADEPHPG